MWSSELVQGPKEVSGFSHMVHIKCWQGIQVRCVARTIKSLQLDTSDCPSLANIAVTPLGNTVWLIVSWILFTARGHLCLLVDVYSQSLYPRMKFSFLARLPLVSTHPNNYIHGKWLHLTGHTGGLNVQMSQGPPYCDKFGLYDCQTLNFKSYLDIFQMSTLFILFCFGDSGLIQPRLALNSLYPKISLNFSGPPVSVSLVLGLEVCTPHPAYGVLGTEPGALYMLS